LNNAIKHDPTIGGRLLAFPYFQSFAGQQLEEVPLELQRYVNGVSDFLGSLIERGNALVISP
jgi:hypothetical protein